MQGLYLHIPFCEQKCIYCDFYSIETTYLIADFVKTLISEIEMRAAELSAEQKRFSTVFFGGGTPSLLSAEQLDEILSALHRNFSFDADSEMTMECNPGTVNLDSLSAYRKLGINRLSFGVQSFHDDDLRFLTRIHSKNEAIEAVSLARKAGFDNVNIDLIFALPNQTREKWLSNLEQAVQLETEHISAYSLIFEEGTPLNAMKLRGEVRPAPEDQDADFYLLTMDFLAKHGYTQYEVSNFSKTGKECRHNLLYWQGKEYVSFGPSAHGYLNSERYWNVSSLKKYSDEVKAGRLPVVNSEKLGKKEKIFERAFLELRSQGIRIAEFQQDFGIEIFDLVQSLLQKYADENFFNILNGKIALTSKGFAVCDELSTEIIMLLEQEIGEEWH